jgi:hypothetical protein
LRPRLFLLVQDSSYDRPGNLSGIVSKSRDPFRVPKVMQIAGSKAIRDDALPISAGIVVVGGVQGLVQVADQM